MDPRVSQLLEDYPEVAELIRPHLTDNRQTLDAIGLAIAEKFEEARSARQSSGVEEIWRKCEEAYEGVDDANRHEANSRWAKPMDPSGPVTSDNPPARQDHRSTAFLGTTARYVNAAAAKIGEILLPADDKPFSISATPVPDVVDAKETGGNAPVFLDDAMQVPALRAAKPGEVPQSPSAPASFLPGGSVPAPAVGSAVPAAGAAGPAPAAPAGPFPPGMMNGQQPTPPLQPPSPPLVQITKKDLAEEAMALAEKKAKAAEKRIWDWMIETQYPAEMRKVIFDAARLGVGVAKGPVPKVLRGMAAKKQGDGLGIEIKERIIPATKWVSPWRIFPDPSCGEYIQDGAWCFEVDYLSETKLRALKKLPGYLSDQIDKVIEQGPDKSYLNEDGKPDADKRAKGKGRFEIRYYHGTLSGEEMDVIAEAATGKKLPDEKKPDEVYAIVTLVNDSVIRATVNPLDSGTTPFHSIPWERRVDHWAGIGVAERVAVPQQMINAATRAMLNNAGISAGAQIVLDYASIVPADGSRVITPNKLWYRTGDAQGVDVRTLFQTFEIPNATQQMIEIINYGMKQAEELTSIPLVTQGQTGPTTPETFGAAQLQDDNSHQLLRSFAYNFDDCITIPKANLYYEWFLLDPDVPEAEKGDFQVNARGSAAHVSRAIQNQFLLQGLNMVQNPTNPFGVNPKLWFAELMRSRQMDPQSVQYTEEEQAKMEQQPPPAPPAVQVAQIRAQTEQAAQAQEAQQAQAEDATANKKIATDATIKLHDIKSNYELALMEYANKRNISLDDAKVELAKATMQLQTEERLNAQNNAHETHREHVRAAVRRQPQQRPPVQAPGRAANGRAFSQVNPQ